MAEISSLKIKLASADKDRRDLDERLRITQVLTGIHEIVAKKKFFSAFWCFVIAIFDSVI